MQPEATPPKCPWKTIDSEPCGRTTDLTSQFCIGHDPNDQKDRWLFVSALRAELESENGEVIDLRGWVFPTDVGDKALDCRGRAFEKFVNLDHAKIRGAVILTVLISPKVLVSTT